MLAWRSTKEEKPTLAGVSTKTRKRNIVIPVDPGSFANAVVTICQDAAEGLTSLDEELEAATKALDNANNLEFSRYSDTLFEVFFAGGMVGAGGKLSGEAGAPKLERNVRCHAGAWGHQAMHVVHSIGRTCHAGAWGNH